MSRLRQPTFLLLTSHWPEASYMTTHNCKEPGDVVLGGENGRVDVGGELQCPPQTSESTSTREVRSGQSITMSAFLPIETAMIILSLAVMCLKSAFSSLVSFLSH